MSKSTRVKVSAKPRKPYAGFPLTPHPSGRWCKKIRGKLHYFGKLDTPEAALERFNREWPFLKDGRTPPPIDTGDGCTIRLLCNAFLTSKKSKLDSAELSPRTFRDYFRTCELLIEQIGRDRRVDDLRSDDFRNLRSKLAKTRGVVALKNEINRCCIVFNFAFDEDLIDKPVRFGQSFDRPSAKSLRKARYEAGPRLFEADEVRRILDAADVQLKAMVFLGLNCGFGNTDVATLPQSAVDLSGGWIDFPRPKTQIARRVPLWPETVIAVRQAIAVRPDPKDPADADRVFITRTGVKWVRTQEKRATEQNGDDEAAVHAATVVSLDALSQHFSKLLKLLKINGRRGLGFYTLRHVFETVAGEAKDQIAVNSIMGHVDTSMAGVYRERISDERLRAVTEHVRTWLFNSGGPAAPARRRNRFPRAPCPSGRPERV